LILLKLFLWVIWGAEDIINIDKNIFIEFKTIVTDLSSHPYVGVRDLSLYSACTMIAFPLCRSYPNSVPRIVQYFLVIGICVLDIGSK
jgi:hypothetical protein